MRAHILGFGALVCLGSAFPASAQSFVSGSAQIPQGGPGNNSSTENVDFADIDGDGDFDAWFADGGDDGNDRDRLWINQGGLQGGTVGFFADDTSARLPNVQDTSRDVDFIDIDLDGDEDAYVSNTSTETNQSNRFFLNQGGLQAGTPGFFVEETSTRWVNLGVNDGTSSLSSIAPQFVLASGGFVDFSCDCVFGDLDNDGDPDLVHTSYDGIFAGEVPSRIFLNDGGGFFEEFNPSGFQLSSDEIHDGDPALWASGVQMHGTQVFDGTQADVADTPLGAELGDVDGDFDLDLLISASHEQPRLFANLLEQDGGILTAFVDATYGAFTGFVTGPGAYEQEFGDMDSDNDLDIYGLNWNASSGFHDITQRNDGTGHYGAWTAVPGSAPDDQEAEWFDFDNDGDLDLYVANFSGQDRLYENSGPAGYTLANVTGSEFVSETKISLGVDSCDVDNDGDYDLMVTQIDFAADDLFLNVTQVADVDGPRVIAEQADDQTGTSNPTRIRARVYDNVSWKVMRYYDTVIEYSVNGGAAQLATMLDAGGQNFTGVIPGGFAGVVEYTVSSTDLAGNTGISSSMSFTITATVDYCTAGTSASGCQALLSNTGTPSASAPAGFTFQATGVEGQKDGLFFFGTHGQQANPWGNGTSYQCVIPPVVRTPILTGIGTVGACDGTLALDLNALWCPTCPKATKNPGAGATVQAQLWYRDPLSTSNQTTSLSDAVEFGVAP